MDLTIFARFHSRPGQAAAVEAALRAVVPPSRREPGCLGIEAHRSVQDADIFFIHSRWVDLAAFEGHATLPHTVAFLATMGPLIDHPLEVSRARPLDPPA
ncbi:MAG: putative quinol monooxygenase [Gemmatimonadota bacterium]